MLAGKVVAVIYIPNAKALFEESGKIERFGPVVAVFTDVGESELRVLDASGGSDPFYCPERLENFKGWSSD